MQPPKLRAICANGNSNSEQGKTEEPVIVSPAKRGGRKWLFLAGGASLLLLLAGAAAFFLLDIYNQAPVAVKPVTPTQTPPYQVVERAETKVEPAPAANSKSVRKEVLQIVEPLLHDIVRLNRRVIEQDRSHKASLQEMVDFVKGDMVRKDVALSTQDQSIARLEKRHQALLKRLKQLEAKQSAAVSVAPAPVKKTSTVSASTPKKYFYELPAGSSPAAANSLKKDTSYYLFAFTDTGAFIRHSSNQDLVVALKGEVLGECGRVLSVKSGSNPVVVTEKCKDIVGI